MLSLGAAQWLSLLLVVAALAGLGGFVSATVVRRKRRTRKVFLAGVFCGLLAGEIVHLRRRGLIALHRTAPPARAALVRRVRQLRT
ncbi:MAG: hypothetical protein WBB00_04190 [Mycobacterium sp.]